MKFEVEGRHCGNLGFSHMQITPVLIQLAVLALIMCQSSFGALGETQEQCNQRYGNGEVVEFNAASKEKTLFYRRFFSANVTAHFRNNIADRICYTSGIPSDSYAAEWLAENSQGHNWQLTESSGRVYRKWVRDDGATAVRTERKSEGGVDVWIESPPPPRAPDPTNRFLSTSVKVILVVVVGYFVLLLAYAAWHDWLRKKSDNQST